MPIIIAGVPSSAEDELLHQLRTEIEDLLVKEGVSRIDVTVDFRNSKAPVRLVGLYLSRSKRLRQKGQAYKEAGMIAELLIMRLEMPVELAVVMLKKEDSAIYLTQ